MSKRYQIVSQDANFESKELATFLARDGQLLLAMLDLVEQAQCAIDELVDVMGRATIEAILQMSAEQLAGSKQQGKPTDRDVYFHGTKKGRVALAERQLKIDKPRLRKKISKKGGSAEVEIPTYAAMQKDTRLTVGAWIRTTSERQRHESLVTQNINDALTDAVRLCQLKDPRPRRTISILP